MPSDLSLSYIVYVKVLRQLKIKKLDILFFLI